MSLSLSGGMWGHTLWVVSKAECPHEFLAEATQQTHGPEAGVGKVTFTCLSKLTKALQQRLPIRTPLQRGVLKSQVPVCRGTAHQQSTRLACMKLQNPSSYPPTARPIQTNHLPAESLEGAQAKTLFQTLRGSQHAAKLRHTTLVSL